MAQGADRRSCWCAGKFYPGLGGDVVEYAKRQFRAQAQVEIVPPPVGEDNSQDKPVLVYLWQWFNDLTDWRDLSFGVGALSHQEIESWARLFRVDISPFEVDVIRRIDREFRAWQAELSDGRAMPTLVDQMRDMAQDAEDLKVARVNEETRKRGR